MIQLNNDHVTQLNYNHVICIFQDLIVIGHGWDWCIVDYYSLGPTKESHCCCWSALLCVCSLDLLCTSQQGENESEFV